jgi:hypothetical protein
MVAIPANRITLAPPVIANKAAIKAKKENS